MLPLSVAPQPMPETQYTKMLPEHPPFFYLERDSELLNVDVVKEVSEFGSHIASFVFHYGDSSNDIAFIDVPEWSQKLVIDALREYEDAFQMNHYHIDSPAQCHIEISRKHSLKILPLGDGESLTVKAVEVDPTIDSIMNILLEVNKNDDS